MMRILVVDDERHVIDSIVHIVRHDLSDGFEIVGSASSGREAIERSAELAPDIVIMDVRMPGVSGIEAIREMRKRGSLAAFLLATAYERFDIAQAAVGLGVVEYLLKPIAKEALMMALGRAAAIVAERSEFEDRELESREREIGTRNFTEAAFLYGIALGERMDRNLPRYRAALGLEERWAMLGVAAFLPPPGSPDREAETLHGRFRDSMRYKTRALVGPLASGRCTMLMPLKSMEDGVSAAEELHRLIECAFSAELVRGTLRIGMGRAVELSEAASSFSEAMRNLVSKSGFRVGSPPGCIDGGENLFSEELVFIEALLGGEPERARLVFESLLMAAATGGTGDAAESARLDGFHASRIVSLLGEATRILARRGLLRGVDVFAAMDLTNLAGAMLAADALGPGPFATSARARFEAMAGAMEKGPRYTASVAKAIAYIHENYKGQASLELAADSAGISPNRLSRLFVAETGRGFSDYLIEYRISKAKDLLSIPGASIKWVSSACGYPDPNYFSRLFKRVTGLTPSAFSTGRVEVQDDID